MSKQNFDPYTGQPINNSGSKTVVFVVVGVIIFAIIVSLGLGAMLMGKMSAKGEEPVEDQPMVEASVEASTEEPKEEVEPAVEEPVKEEETTSEEPFQEPVVEKAVTDENSLFAIKIGNSVYQMPEQTKKFLVEGWTFYNPSDADEMIGTGDRFYTDIIPPGCDKRQSVSVTITNFSLDALAAKDAYVSELSFNVYNEGDVGVDVTTLGGKIKLGESTRADIEEAYGKPDDTVDSSSGTSYFYNDNESSSFDKPHIMIRFEDDVFISIAIKNNDEPKGFRQTEVSGDAPEYLSKYVAPSELGDDPFSGNFMLDGVVYNLPVPLQVLADNGWTYEADGDYLVGAGEEYVFSLYKGDKFFSVNVANFDTKATTLKNTIVVSLSSHKGLGYEETEFPGGLMSTWTEKQVLKWFDDHGITDHEMRATAYSVPFSNGHGRYNIYVNDGHVSFIEIRNYGWLKD